MPLYPSQRAVKTWSRCCNQVMNRFLLLYKNPLGSEDDLKYPYKNPAKL